MSFMMFLLAVMYFCGKVGGNIFKSELKIDPEFSVIYPIRFSDFLSVLTASVFAYFTSSDKSISKDIPASCPHKPWIISNDCGPMPSCR